MRGFLSPRISVQPKLIYFAERRASFSDEQFKARWRQHGRLGMSLPRWQNIYRYCQCDSVRNLPAPSPLLDCAGVAMVWYRSEATRQSHISDEHGGRAVMRQDEAETFARPVAQFSWLANEAVFKELADPALKLVIQLRAAGPGTDDGPCFPPEHAGQMMAALGRQTNVFGYVWNARHPAWSGGIACDVVEEIGLPRLTDTQTADIVSVIAGVYERSAFSCIGSVWTEEVELYRVSDGD